MNIIARCGFDRCNWTHLRHYKGFHTIERVKEMARRHVHARHGVEAHELDPHDEGWCHRLMRHVFNIERPDEDTIRAAFHRPRPGASPVDV